MTNALQETDFVTYPPQARALAVTNLAMLRRLPPVFALVLLREISTYDWKFPAERRQMERELALLGRQDQNQLQTGVQSFAKIALGPEPGPEVAQASCAANPSACMERLTAWLWSSGQMEAFRASAEQYAGLLAQAIPAPRPQQRRLGIVLIGQSATEPAPATLFRRLRPHGLTLTRVDPTDGVKHVLAAASARCAAGEPYRHWFLSGGAAAGVPGLTEIAYERLQPPLGKLLGLIQAEIDSGDAGPERLRSSIAQISPAQIGLGTPGSDPVLDHFAVSLLTEGSGTQIFATTFAQWAARECLRRAQPETLVVRYAPRREMQPMNTMLENGRPGARPEELDVQGSLVDGEMGAYYTWLNMNRLSGADEMSFLAWFEGHGTAVAIGPGLPRGSTSDDSMTMPKVLGLLA